METRDKKLWYYTSYGTQRGPVNSEQLVDAARSGLINYYQDKVWTDGMPHWIPASSMTGLFTSPPTSSFERVLRAIFGAILGIVIALGAATVVAGGTLIAINLIKRRCFIGNYRLSKHSFDACINYISAYTRRGDYCITLGNIYWSIYRLALERLGNDLQRSL